VQLNDLDQVPQDIEQMSELFTLLKFNEIITCKEGNYEEINKAYKKIYAMMKKAHTTKDGSNKLLVYIYYSGHGVM